jgi:cytochrome c553
VKRTVLKLVGTAAGVAFAAFLIAWSGLLPIAASSGHWAVTSWFLHFTMRQSVETHAMGIKVPPLDDPSLVLRGGGHYASGCAPCHGAPGEQRALVAQHMTPQPPYLPPRIARWQPNELFWIVKHGIKFTAMPAWVAQQREDEVWAVVAFLRRLPSLDAQEYRQIALNEFPAAEDDWRDNSRLRGLDDRIADLAQTCARCHGPDGGGRGLGAFPKLALQTEQYLYASLLAFARGERYSGIMQPIAAGLDDQAMRTLARHFAGQRAVQAGPVPAVPADVLELGRSIARNGVPEQGVPACVSCHGPKQTPRSPVYPVLEGQYADYLALQLRLFSADKRGGTPYAHLMRAVAQRLSSEQIKAVASYYASLRPAAVNRSAEPGVVTGEPADDGG